MHNEAVQCDVFEIRIYIKYNNVNQIVIDIFQAQMIIGIACNNAVQFYFLNHPKMTSTSFQVAMQTTVLKMGFIKTTNH